MFKEIQEKKVRLKGEFIFKDFMLKIDDRVQMEVQVGETMGSECLGYVVLFEEEWVEVGARIFHGVLQRGG